MSDLERAAAAAGIRLQQYPFALPSTAKVPRAKDELVVRAVLQAALDAGEIVLADRSVTPADWLTERPRAEAAEQALVLANQDAQRLANLVRTVTFMGEDYWELEQENALAAHDLRVAQQEGT